MGSGCSKNEDEYFEETIQEEKIDLIKIKEEDFKNKILSFTKSFENILQPLSNMQLENFLILVNNYKRKKNELIKSESINNNDVSEKENLEKNVYRKTHNPQISNITKSFKNMLIQANDPNNKKNEINSNFYKNVIDEGDFSTFIKSKIITNPLSEKDISDKNTNDNYLFEKYLKECFYSFQQYLFKNKDKITLTNDFSEVPIFLISSLGFNYCKSQRSKKILLLFNMLSNGEGVITQANPNVEAFLYCYLRNCVFSPMFFLLMELEKNRNSFKKEILQFIDEDDFGILERNFYIKNFKSEKPSLIFKDIKNEKEEIDIRVIFDAYCKDVLKLIFGSAGKKELRKQQFIKFLSDEEEGGGLWLLFNEGIRKRFEKFLENQSL